MKALSSKNRSILALNIVKYLLCLPSARILYESSKYSAGWRIIPVLSIIYCCFWDIYFDWELTNKQFRSTLGSAVPFLVLNNILLRLCPLAIFYYKSSKMSLIFNGLEILRRLVWIHVRIANHIYEENRAL